MWITKFSIVITQKTADTKLSQRLNQRWTLTEVGLLFGGNPFLQQLRKICRIMYHIDSNIFIVSSFMHHNDMHGIGCKIYSRLIERQVKQLAREK